MEQTAITKTAASKGFLESIISYFSPASIISRAIAIAIILLIAGILTRIVLRIFRDMLAHNRISSIFASLMRKTLNAIIWVIAAICVLQTVGVNLTPVIAGLGVSGVVLGLALQETIASFFSGLIIAVKKPFEIGDYVSIDGTEGTVRSMDMMGITLTSSDNKLITMSNKNVWGSVIINSSALDKRRVDMIVTVSYDTDLEKAKAVLTDLITSYPEVLKDPEPRVEVHTLADSSINFIVRPWTANSDYWSVYWKFQKDVVEVLGKNGIEIPYNKLDVNLIKS